MTWVKMRKHTGPRKLRDAVSYEKDVELESLLAGAVFDGLLRTDLNAGAALDTVIDSFSNGFSVFDLVDFSRTIVRTISMPGAFVVINLDGQVIILPCLNHHMRFPFEVEMNSCK